MIYLGLAKHALFHQQLSDLNAFQSASLNANARDSIGAKAGRLKEKGPLKRCNRDSSELPGLGL
jgi:hypothetical protein